MTATSAFITSLVSYFGVFCGLVLCFVILSKRPGNHNIYYSARILAGDGPPRSAKGRSPFAWIKEAFMATDEELVRVAGLDAAIYINFFSTGVILSPISLCVPFIFLEFLINLECVSKF
jgi:hypothetical protein